MKKNALVDEIVLAAACIVDHVRNPLLVQVHRDRVADMLGRLGEELLRRLLIREALDVLKTSGAAEISQRFTKTEQRQDASI